MSLTSGHTITRYSWTVIPMTQFVIDTVNNFGKDQPALITLFNRKGQPIGDSYLITGVDETEPNDSKHWEKRLPKLSILR